MKYIKGWESYNESNESNPQQFDYMMLGRLQRDCEYYLGNGGRHEKHLWANTVEEHIAEMKKLWNGLIEKPEWLSMEDILDYEKQMTTDTEGEEYNTDTDTIIENEESSSTSSMNLEEDIINYAISIAESQLDYQDEVIDNLADALAIILSDTQLGDKYDSSEIYDYFDSIIKK